MNTPEAEKNTPKKDSTTLKIIIGVSLFIFIVSSAFGLLYFAFFVNNETADPVVNKVKNEEKQVVENVEKKSKDELLNSKEPEINTNKEVIAETGKKIPADPKLETELTKEPVVKKLSLPIKREDAIISAKKVVLLARENASSVDSIMDDIKNPDENIILENADEKSDLANNLDKTKQDEGSEGVLSKSEDAEMKNPINPFTATHGLNGLNSYVDEKTDHKVTEDFSDNSWITVNKSKNTIVPSKQKLSIISESNAPPNPKVIHFLEQLEINGVKLGGENSKVLISNKAYREGATVNNEHKLKVARISSHEIIFIDSKKVTYIKHF